MRPITALALVGGIALAAYASQSSGTAVWDVGPDVTPPDPSIPPPDQAAVNEEFATVSDQPTAPDRITALLQSIGRFESNNDYSKLYGGGHFSDFSKHPRKAIPINLPGYEGKFSTAAGYFQINWPTYQEFAPGLGITDFSPESQWRLGEAILQNTGGYDAALAGDIAGAFQLASKRWASLPGSKANQNPQTLATAIDYFNSILGTG